MKKLFAFFAVICAADSLALAQENVFEKCVDARCEAYVENNQVCVFVILKNKYDSGIGITLDPLKDIKIELKNEKGEVAKNLCHGGSWLSGPISLYIPLGSELRWMITPQIEGEKEITFIMPDYIWKLPEDKVGQYSFDLQIKGIFSGNREKYDPMLVTPLWSVRNLKIQKQKQPNPTVQTKSSPIGLLKQARRD